MSKKIAAALLFGLFAGLLNGCVKGDAVSKAETSTPANVISSKKVLIVLSSESVLTLKNGGTYPTGYFLRELSVPAKQLVDAGFNLVFADPKGNTPTMDKRSDNVTAFSGDAALYQEIRQFYDLTLVPQLQSPLSLQEVIAGGLDQYAAIFIPGGHAPMIDLMASSELGQILRHFHDASKPTALLCHGTVALVAAVTNPQAYQQAIIAGDLPAAEAQVGSWPYAGYHMTAFSTAEEQLAAPSIGGKVQFNIETALQEAGLIVEVTTPRKSEVVHDRELLTGQNPYSDEELGRDLVQVLTGSN